MKPSELYERTPEKIDGDINILHGCYYNHVPDIQEWSGFWINEKLNTRVKIHYYKDFSFDGRRIWRLAAVKFDDHFVMIIQNAGREGDDHYARFVTDKSMYINMVTYIRSLIPVDEEVREVVDLDKDIPGLTNFYGNDLDGFFERYRY